MIQLYTIVTEYIKIFIGYIRFQYNSYNIYNYNIIEYTKFWNFSIEERFRSLLDLHSNTALNFTEKCSDFMVSHNEKWTSPHSCWQWPPPTHSTWCGPKAGHACTWPCVDFPGPLGWAHLSGDRESAEGSWDASGLPHKQGGKIPKGSLSFSMLPRW